MNSESNKEKQTEQETPREIIGDLKESIDIEDVMKKKANKSTVEIVLGLLFPNSNGLNPSSSGLENSK